MCFWITEKARIIYSWLIVIKFLACIHVDLVVAVALPSLSLKKPSESFSEGTVDDASLSNERECRRRGKVAKVVFYWVNIQLTMLGFLAPCTNQTKLWSDSSFAVQAQPFNLIIVAICKQVPR